MVEVAEKLAPEMAQEEEVVEEPDSSSQLSISTPLASLPDEAPATSSLELHRESRGEGEEAEVWMGER